MLLDQPIDEENSFISCDSDDAIKNAVAPAKPSSCDKDSFMERLPLQLYIVHKCMTLDELSRKTSTNRPSPTYSTRPITPEQQLPSAPSFSTENTRIMEIPTVRSPINTMGQECIVSEGRWGNDLIPRHIYGDGRCANCNRVGHDLSICVGPPGLDGTIHGCPHCNTTAHRFDDCIRLRWINEDLVYYYLVMLRGRRPPISTEEDYLGMILARPPSEFYPWTREFSTGVSGSSYQRYDYSSDDPSTLPEDPATANQRAVWVFYNTPYKRFKGQRRG
ncbi:hypothetical protein F5Y00DRAFT_259162 [Daldinia vernicosa]|uniref:uncharacterized protein n=1 Tax=Daldinia vernicosa TaxID=114800 RepID=UPI002007D6F3|nr:uncharacterized protein F5Y00DRAFT_259162 [Daldinia vernicosa]KAI0851674.1 hypothetical protein F5Y00DRAFT_259162 [Daldinia vernicosa]